MPKLLICAASPQDQDRLRLNSEVQSIRDALRRSVNREHWTIETNEAATVDHLRRALLDFGPTIVHFAGHGGEDGLCFEDDAGNTHMAAAVPLTKLFHIFKDTLKCVILNSCYSESQALHISQEIDYVVGMRTAVEDASARKFAVSFYDAIFAGTDFRTAFNLGCTAIDLNNMRNADVPVFLTGSHLAPSKLEYTAQIPEIERVLYAYFNTPRLDRAPLTTTGTSLKPMLLRHYGNAVTYKIDSVTVDGMIEIEPERWKVVVELIGGKRMERTTVYLRIHGRSILVEWEATVGLWSIPIKTFIAMGSNVPVVARVAVELSDYYNFWFSDKQVYFQSTLLRSLSGDSIHGYIPRNTLAFESIIPLLTDGNSHEMTLELESTEEGSVAIVRRMISPTWLIHENPSA